MPRPKKTKTVYTVVYMLVRTRPCWREQFETTCELADRHGLDLIDIRNTDGDDGQMLGRKYHAIMVGDLHSVFSFTAHVGYQPLSMKQFEVSLQ